ncbi:MAG: SpoIIE family protein phosphatase [Lachnospiraceae bacterium]|nr:SpoIIE family protein phosphatase [Lachnospiraceae bacterium]
MDKSESNVRIRRPIRKKVQKVTLAIVLVSVAIVFIVGLIAMYFIKSLGEKALTDQMGNNLEEVVRNKADLAASEFGKFAGYIDFLGDYTEEMYYNKEMLTGIGVEINPPLPTTGEDELALTRTIANKSVSIKDPVIYDQMLFLSNLEHVFDPIIRENRDIIQTIYVSTKEGLMVSYDAWSYIAVPEPPDTEFYYEYRERNWFVQGKSTEGVYFTDAYPDGQGRGLTITCARAIKDEKGEFAGTMAQDLSITGIYDKLVDLDLGDGAYVLLADKNGKIISPDDDSLMLKDDPGIDEYVLSEMASRNTGVHLTKGGVYYIYAPVEGMDWGLLAHVPKELVVMPVRAMDQVILFMIMLFVVVVMVVFINVFTIINSFSKKLTDPIVDLESDVKEIAAGNLDKRAKVYDNDEIGDLAEKFNEMAVALKNRIKEITSITAERERLNAEINVAAKIQEDMLPSVFPAFPERKDFDIYASMHPAKEIGGDFYDFYLIDDDHLALVMADVSGKGMPAAMFMATTMTLIENTSKSDSSPSKILEIVNEGLCRKNKEGLFVTVWLGILNLSTGDLLYSSAGHEYPVHKTEDLDYMIIVSENDPPLGTEETMTFAERKLKLLPGDSLCLYTDGVTDAKNAEGERYGMERVVMELDEKKDESAKAQVIAVNDSVREFCGDMDAFDDITMLVLNYFGK